MPIINIPPTPPSSQSAMQQMQDKMKELQSQTGGMQDSTGPTEAGLKQDIAEANATIKREKEELKQHKAEGNFGAQILDQVAIAQAKSERAQARLQLKELKAQTAPIEPGVGGCPAS